MRPLVIRDLPAARFLPLCLMVGSHPHAPTIAGGFTLNLHLTLFHVAICARVGGTTIVLVAKTFS